MNHQFVKDTYGRYRCKKCHITVVLGGVDTISIVNSRLPICGEATKEGVQKLRLQQSHPIPAVGVGTELKILLRRFGISPKSCQCDHRAMLMDLEGPDWCEQNRETIVDWLQEAAVKRHLPFLRPAGRTLVCWAVRRARAKLRILEATQ